MDIVGAIAGAGQTLKLIKELKSLDSSLEIAEFKAQMAELYNSVGDLRIALADANDIIQSKNNEINKLAVHTKISSNTTTIDGFKFEADRSGNAIGRAYCPKCDAVDKQFIVLVDHSVEFGKTICPVCKRPFLSKNTIIGYQSDNGAEIVRVRSDFDVF